MSKPEDRLHELEREVRASAEAAHQAELAERAKAPAAEQPKRALRRNTRRKILVAVALVLSFLLVWKKVNIHFVVFTSFWGFLGILLAVFAVVYLTLRFFFEEKSEE